MASSRVDAQALRFDVDRLPVDADLIDRYRRRYGPIYQLASAHVELSIMKRTLDQVPAEPAPRERGIAMPANIAERVKGAFHIGQHSAFAVDRNPFHLAWRQFDRLSDGNEPIGHSNSLQRFPSPRIAERAGVRGFWSVRPESEQLRRIVRGDL